MKFSLRSVGLRLLYVVALNAGRLGKALSHWFGGHGRYLARASLSPEDEIWRAVFRLWDLNRNRFLAQGSDRPCPVCENRQRQHLWHSQDGYEYVICLACRMVYCVPCLPYSVWDRYAGESDSEHRALIARVAELRLSEEYRKGEAERFSLYLWRLKRYIQSGRLLDVGCFTGNFLRFAERHGFQGVGVECSPVAVELGRARHGLQLYQGYFEELELAPVAQAGPYSLVTFWETLEHMNYPGEALARAHRLLAPGGIVAVTTPNFNNLQLQLLHERCSHCLGGPGNPGHMNMFTATSLRQLLAKHRFCVEELTTLGGSDYVDIANFLAGRLEQINCYSNAVREPPLQAEGWDLPYPLLLRLMLRLSPVLKACEILLGKGALVFAIAHRMN